MRHRMLTTLLVLLAAILLVATPALAGKEGKEADSYKKCDMNTQDCLNKMAEWAKTSGWVGIEYEPQADAYWRIVTVVPDSPAEAGGLKPGDVVFAMYGIEFSEENSKQLKQARKDWAPGQEVVYTVKRNGYDKEISLTLAPMPADVMAKWIGGHMMDHAEMGDVAEATP